MLKMLLFALALPGTLIVIVPHWLLSISTDAATGPASAARLAGLVPIVLGMLLHAWCARGLVSRDQNARIPFNAREPLVIDGLYRYTRNPLYAGVVLILFGEAAFFESTPLLLYTLLVLIGFHFRVIGCEEPLLVRRFGEAYLRYCRRVRRWI
jgi:protein-S-isoprenylcysteine O-methyltransferase Ste14